MKTKLLQNLSSCFCVDRSFHFFAMNFWVFKDSPDKYSYHLRNISNFFMPVVPFCYFSPSLHESCSCTTLSVFHVLRIEYHGSFNLYCPVNKCIFIWILLFSYNFCWIVSLYGLYARTAGRRGNYCFIIESVYLYYLSNLKETQWNEACSSILLFKDKSSRFPLCCWW